VKPALRIPEKFTDVLTQALSVALAAAVVVFAAYKVLRLNGMEDPPANMGLNFPPAKRKLIVDQSVAGADPITTQTLAPVQLSAPGGGTTTSGPVRSYELLAVVDGVAFVEVDVARGKMLIPATAGSLLPGGLRIDSIIQRDGRWVLTAGLVRLEKADSPVQ
jgi:hypothetical protein